MKDHGCRWEGQSGGDIAKVTTRLLLQMRAGIGDYDDGCNPRDDCWRLGCILPRVPARIVRTGLFSWTLQHPNDDFGAMDLINQVSKQFLFPPGTGAFYSSTGYVLAGLVLS